MCASGIAVTVAPVRRQLILENKYIVREITAQLEEITNGIGRKTRFRCRAKEQKIIKRTIRDLIQLYDSEGLEGHLLARRGLVIDKSGKGTGFDVYAFERSISDRSAFDRLPYAHYFFTYDGDMTRCHGFRKKRS